MSQSANRPFGVFFGVVYLVLGALGFVYSQGGAFFATSGGRIFGIFQVNTAHNIVHLAIGAILVIGALAGVRAAKAVNTIVGVLFLILGAAGLFLVGTTANIFAINSADNVMHFATAAVLLVVGIGADKQAQKAVVA